MSVWLAGIGVNAPGLSGWSQARAVLAGEQPYRAEPLPAPRTSLLGANERRRTTPVIRLALQTAEQALADADVAVERLCSVFASSSGDMEIVDRICAALDTPERPVSPTQFHNSVHNAPAGYWSLGTAVRMPSTSVAAYDYSFAAGLLEAWTTVQVETVPVLLVAYDWPPPTTLRHHRPLQHPFAVAMVLSEQQMTADSAPLALRLEAGTADHAADAGLDALRCDNPAARSIPLLAAIAKGDAAAVSLPYSETQVLTVQWQEN